MGFGTWRGTVTLRLVSAQWENSLEALRNAGIILENVVLIDQLTISFSVRQQNLELVQTIARKRGEKLEIDSRRGVIYKIRGLIRRPVLVAGMLLLLWLSVWAPGRVFFVLVDGNVTVPANLIMEQAAKCGVDFGASRKAVRSEKVKNALLEIMPQLQWVGVNTYGCVAVISVTERQVQEVPQQTHQVTSMIAICDAVVGEMTVLQGNAVCTVGQAVKKGQVLISGYTDCGICIRATQAQGEVYGETRRNLCAVIPINYQARGEILSVSKKYGLIIGKKRINFDNSSGISGGECVRIYSERYITLPGGFRLPVAIVTEQWITYAPTACTLEDPALILQPLIADYLRSQMIGGRILLSSQVVSRTEDLFRIDGIYSCYEMIGIIRTEENFAEYENYRTDGKRGTGG